MGRLPKKVDGFQECVTGGRQLSCGGQDDAESFFRRAAIGQLAFSVTIKGLCATENIFFRQIAGL